MYLKRLELTGFKSFARPTFLDFSSPVTAIVGPNGSGKSNIAESIQWVLGEQSLKSLRGKKSEDFIFNGSEKANQLGRASVSLIFDNSKKIFPIAFEKVKIERKVFRDGVNEYFINNSRTRLKDVVELLTNVGIGTSRHHIISQGESDRMLYASPEERKEMIEDALGLKVYQLKRKETEKKIRATEENMRQVESLRKEIQPHLKFLKNQSEKFQTASKIKEELIDAYKKYIGQTEFFLKAKEEKIEEKRRKPRKELESLEKKLKDVKNFFEKEQQFSLAGELDKIEFQIKDLSGKRLEIERERGKIEGMIELKRKESKERETVPVERGVFKNMISQVERGIEKALLNQAIGEIKNILADIRALIRNFSDSILGAKESGVANELEALGLKEKNISEMLEKIGKEAKELDERRFQLKKMEQEERNKRIESEKNLYKDQERFNVIKDELRSLEIEEEKLKIGKEEFEKYLKEAEHYQVFPEADNQTDNFEALPVSFRENARQIIERLKIRMEEAGGVDPDIMKEYSEVSSRDEFFQKELEDLDKAALSCKKVSEDLKTRVENEFKNGLEKINTELQKFFISIFGGGKAILKITNIQKRRVKEEEFLEESENYSPAAGGVEITVDIPRKRIKSLDSLSGGERALTSSALLFAMSSVNPPPFFVLDESDAAFDEANSKRYAQMLGSLSKTTQLIIITHNRETMKKAGVLYGVTMGADSISRLLSVKLEETAEIAA